MKDRVLITLVFAICSIGGYRLYIGDQRVFSLFELVALASMPIIVVSWIVESFRPSVRYLIPLAAAALGVVALVIDQLYGAGFQGARKYLVLAGSMIAFGEIARRAPMKAEIAAVILLVSIGLFNAYDYTRTRTASFQNIADAIRVTDAFLVVTALAIVPRSLLGRFAVLAIGLVGIGFGLRFRGLVGIAIIMGALLVLLHVGRSMRSAKIKTAVVVIGALLGTQVYSLKNELSFWGFDEIEARVNLSSNAERDMLMDHALELFASSPITGVGTDAQSQIMYVKKRAGIDEEFVSIAVHSWAVQVLYEHGIIGIAIWSCMLIGVLAAMFASLEIVADRPRFLLLPVFGCSYMLYAAYGIPIGGFRSVELGAMIGLMLGLYPRLRPMGHGRDVGGGFQKRRNTMQPYHRDRLRGADFPTIVLEPRPE
jgi:hypothetical protein